MTVTDTETVSGKIETEADEAEKGETGTDR